MGVRDLSQLRAEARYRRERFDLYKQKLYSSGPLNLRRLRELRWAKEFAEGRLRRAESDEADEPGGKPGARPADPPTRPRPA